jgi:hypothetical protein
VFSDKLPEIPKRYEQLQSRCTLPPLAPSGTLLSGGSEGRGACAGFSAAVPVLSISWLSFRLLYLHQQILSSLAPSIPVQWLKKKKKR